MKTVPQIQEELDGTQLAIAEAFDERDLERWQYQKGWEAALKWVLESNGTLCE